jgi:hypothetical protein
MERLAVTCGASAPSLIALASAAYYGGRFEVTRIGAIGGPIFDYDINSAYPDVMRDLPCLEHGEWREWSARAMALDLDPACHVFVAPLRFDHGSASREASGDRMNVCGLPIRQKSGRLFWPVKGAGVYWSCEDVGGSNRLRGAGIRLYQAMRLPAVRMGGPAL